MQTTDFDIRKLSVAERIQLAEDLWGGVVAATADVSLPDAQRAELARRLHDLERDPDAGEPRDVVRARIENRLAKPE